MTRLFIRTFLFDPKNPQSQEHAHDAEPVMTAPLLLLGVLTLVSGYVVFDAVGEALGFPGGIAKFVYETEPEPFHFPWNVAIASTVIALASIGAGYWAWAAEMKPARRAGEMFRPVYLLLLNRYYIDDIYQWVINRLVLAGGGIIAWFDRNIVNDTAVDGTAGLGYFAGFEFKFLQTGKLPNYALAIASGVIIISILFLALEVY
jgi:NADH-quinone oxidoreductase subunit L